jgi:hypothetical protein
MVKKLKFVILGAVALASAGYLAATDIGFVGREAVAQTSDESSSASAADYPTSGVRQGVWNDGQAALWDFNMTDHFRWFGPEQRLRGYKPEQPIKFSHITHVQKNKMECQYCHWSVAKASDAAIPEVETCYGCHGPLQGPSALIPGSTEESKKEIEKIVEYHKAGKPIPWVKVHVMPDYLKFNHKRHVKAGVSCQSCHGQIPEMEQVERVSSMKMGWCISCHRQQGASIDCLACHGHR